MTETDVMEYWAARQAESAAQIRRCRFWQRAAHQMIRRSSKGDGTATMACFHAFERAEMLMDGKRRWYVLAGERAAGRSDALL